LLQFVFSNAACEDCHLFECYAKDFAGYPEILSHQIINMQ